MVQARYYINTLSLINAPLGLLWISCLIWSSPTGLSLLFNTLKCWNFFLKSKIIYHFICVDLEIYWDKVNETTFYCQDYRKALLKTHQSIFPASDQMTIYLMKFSLKNKIDDFKSFSNEVPECVSVLRLAVFGRGMTRFQ